jgi:hypothetical protein
VGERLRWNTAQDPLAVQAILAHLGRAAAPHGVTLAGPHPGRQPYHSAYSLTTPMLPNRMAGRQRAIAIPAFPFASQRHRRSRRIISAVPLD